MERRKKGELGTKGGSGEGKGEVVMKRERWRRGVLKVGEK